jgi:dienelactone hydrolase
MRLIKLFALLTILFVPISSWALQADQTLGGQRIDASPNKANDELAKRFAYDRSAVFDLREVSTREQNGVIIQDINYAAQTRQRERIKAYLIKPNGNAPSAGVLFFHWLGTPNGDRTQFLDEAVALAKLGVVSLLIQGYFPWVVEPADGQTDGQRVVDETKEVRRGLDLLLSQRNVDGERIGYVGHDYGAMYGSLAAAVDKRVKTYILIAGIGSFSDWSLEYWLKAKPADFKASYREALRDLEPIALIDRAAPAALLFQFSKTDKYIPIEAATAFYDAAKQPKQIKWYDTTHEMKIETARKDRSEWLTQKLGLTKAAN